MLITPLVIGAPPISGGEDEAGEYCPDNADDHVQEDSLLAVGPHDHAGNPADETADDEKNDDTHV